MTAQQSIVTFVAMTLCAVADESQPGPLVRFGGPPEFVLLAVIQDPAVQTALHLTEDQIEVIDGMGQQRVKAWLVIRKLDPAVRHSKGEEFEESQRRCLASILDPDQWRRLRQLYLQKLGVHAFGDPDVVKALRLNNEQTDKLAAIWKEERSKAAEEYAGITHGDPEEFSGERNKARRDKVRQIRTAANQAALRVLTVEQQGRWREMVGPPFEGDLWIDAPPAKRQVAPKIKERLASPTRQRGMP